MIMKMVAIWEKAKPDIESIRGLNLAAVMHTTVQMTRNHHETHRKHLKKSLILTLFTEWRAFIYYL
jgi:hypothetical protein